MPRGKRAIGFGAGTVIAVWMLLSGCASTTTTRPTDTPAATPTPAFTSDADATAAAIAFYKKYLKVASAIAESDSSNSERLKVYLSATQYESEAADVKNLRDAHLHYGGPLRLSKYKAQEVNLVDGAVTAYMCLDTSRARILNRAGRDITPDARADKSTLLVKVEGLPEHPLIDSSVTWSGTSIC